MKHIKYLIVAVTGLMLNSCSEDFLSPVPDTAIAVDDFFKTDEDVLAGIIGVYDALQGKSENFETNITRANRGVQFEHLITEHRTDNTRNLTLEGSKSDFHRYVVDANNVESEDYYQSMYEVIFRVNNVLRYIDVADETNQAKYTAEVKFLRAYAYFKLVRLYSDVPLVTSVIEATDDVTPLFTRVPAVEIYAQIEADLLEAIGVLDNTFKSRASKAAAQGILAKVYLTQPNRNYSGAQQLCQAIITSEQYSLVDNFRDVFYNELNSEIIFAIQYQFGDALESQGFSAEFTSTSRQGRDDGQNIVNANLIADFEMFGGNRTEVSYFTFSNNRSEVAKFLPQGTDLTTSPPNYGTNPQRAGNDYIALRYADVLLMYVEAVMAGGAQTINSDALNYFQMVRNRAGLTDTVNLITKDDLLVERRVEFAFENQRWFDLLRFGVADAVLSAHADEMGYIFTPRALLLPIPSREINLSGGLLTQNPGY